MDPWGFFQTPTLVGPTIYVTPPSPSGGQILTTPINEPQNNDTLDRIPDNTGLNEGQHGDEVPENQQVDHDSSKGGNQNQQVDDVAREYGLDPKELRRYVEDSKDGVGRGPADNYTYQELREPSVPI